MKLGGTRRNARTDVDMVPMINFAFLLLVFFLLIGRIAPAEPLAVVPARSATLDPAQAAGDVLLVASDGRLAFTGPGSAGGLRGAFDEVALPARAAAWVAAHPHEPLPVKADARFEATQMIGLLDVLRDAGVREVRLLTVPARGGVDASSVQAAR